MQNFFRLFLIFVSMMVCYNHGTEAHPHRVIHLSPSKYVNNLVWRQVERYLIPDDHPIKKKLDEIFSHSRALADQQSMEEAGFDCLPPQHRTKMVVAKHPELPGYVLKLYFDKQKYYRGKPEHLHWIKRINGARLIRNYIRKYKYGDLFKAPRKWIYLLPDKPSPPKGSIRKKFILVAEDMELFDEKTNEELWGSEKVTKELLKGFYRITTDLGLRDSSKPCNCQFSIDGKAAFIDTEVFHREDVRYRLMTPFLSPPMKSYWNEITHKEKK